MVLISLTTSIKSVWIEYLSGLFLVPQIMHTFYEGKRLNTPFRYVLLIAISRILLMVKSLFLLMFIFQVYLKIYPENVYKFSPDLIFTMTYIGLIVFQVYSKSNFCIYPVQVILLTIQNWYPRMFFKINRFDYKISLKTIEEKRV